MNEDNDISAEEDKRQKHRHRYRTVKYSQNWGPEVVKLRNIMQSEQRRLGITQSEIQLAYYFYADPAFWMADFIFDKGRHRFYLESSLMWIKVLALLEKSLSKDEFLTSLGVTQEEARKLVWKDFNRSGFPALAKRFKKKLPPERMTVVQKRRLRKEHLEILARFSPPPTH